MKLTPTVEWTLVAVLIVYIAFTPGFPIIKQVLLTPIGRAAALGVIAYVWKTVSPLVAALMLVSYLRCIPSNVWEGMDNIGPEDKFERSCECPNTSFTYDKSSKKCVNDKGDFTNPTSCSCGPGMTYNAEKKECELTLIETQAIVPPAPVAVEASSSTAAPAGASATGATGTAPDTSVATANSTAASGTAEVARFTNMSDMMPAEKFSTYYPLN
jgi:hypothetical protein